MITLIETQITSSLGYTLGTQVVLGAAAATRPWAVLPWMMITVSVLPLSLSHIFALHRVYLKKNFGERIW